MTTPVSARAPAARAVEATKVYGQGDAAVCALAGVTVGFPTGRFTAIMGPSGSGKSTLMQCVAGLDRLGSGAAFIGDTELGGLWNHRPHALALLPARFHLSAIQPDRNAHS